jgi:hypothetical protein
VTASTKKQAAFMTSKKKKKKKKGGAARWSLEFIGKCLTCFSLLSEKNTTNPIMTYFFTVSLLLFLHPSDYGIISMKREIEFLPQLFE